MKEQKRPFCAKWHHILIFISLFMQDGGISRQRSFCLPAGGLTTFSSRSDVRSRKWREMELSPVYFYLLHFLRSHHHLNVFHICLFSLWFHSSGAAQKTRESLLSLVTPKIKFFLKSEKNPSWESPISTMMMRNSCVTHFIDRLLTSCHLRTLAYLTDSLFLARLVQVMAQIK